MKKTALVTILATLLVAAAARAAGGSYTSLVVTMTDGTETRLSVDNLEMTFTGGQLVAVNADGQLLLPLGSLASMHFGQGTPTAIGAALTTGSLSQAVDVFTPSGLYMGSFSSMAQAESSLRAGLYVMKTNSRTFKRMIR